MSDVYIPGIRSRFNNEKVIEDLMKLERVPKERAEKNIERIEAEKGYWQEINNRTKSLRDSARNLFSFQNPFNDRIVRSSDESILTGTAVRDAIQQDRSFTVKQIAQADRFLSAPLADDFRVESGTYTFSVGNDEISFDFRGGTLREFTDVLNRRGRDKLQSSLVAVKSGTQSLLIESKITGEENRLGFAGAAIRLGEETGMIEQTNDSRRDFLASSLKVEAGSSVQIPMNLPTTGNLVLKFEVSTEPFPTEPWSPLPGPSIPGTGSVSYGGIVIESDNNSVTLPQQRTQPEKVDNMQILSLGFSDGSSLELSPISDSDEYITYQYELETIVSGKTIVFLNLINNNTHRDVSIQNVQVFDPVAMGGVKPLNAVSTAQDAVISMEGIEVRRSKNEINDLVPGLTITARGTSDRPIKLQIESDTEGVKDAIITFIGNYNRLMTEVNILTRSDERVINEITYLNREERESYKKQLGAFMGDSTLMQLRTSLMRIVSASYPTSAEQDLALLAQIGIGTDVYRSGGADASRLRGYLEIDEKVLDAAISSKLPAIRQLFGTDTTGDLLVDTGVAFSLDALTRPYTESTGLFAQKANSMNLRIDQEKRRIATLDRQLAAKEADLKKQYSMMEGAYNRMEQMSTSFDRFQQQNSNNQR